MRMPQPEVDATTSIGHSWPAGGQRESGPSEHGLCIYGMLEDNVIVPMLGPGVHHLHGPWWLLEVKGLINQG